MCGIAGIVSPSGFDPQHLVEATHLVKHRGPDGYGFAYFCQIPGCRGQVILNEDRLPAERAIVGLGHRRLAILDLSPSGSQPMQSLDGVLTVIFNGEIYNYLEIREDLKALGCAFRTGTDTEVLLQAYRQWGRECLHRFNGMWSFAIWDSSHARLFCARDRFGIKPFYYYCDSKRFLFGSEIKQLLRFPDVPRRANAARVWDYLESGILSHDEETLFQGIRELRGGHSLTLDVGFGEMSPTIERYWDLEVRPQSELSEGAACERFLETFSDAVRIRLRSDVPVGSCLSGGLDSSSIVAVAQRLANHNNFHTFSACFDDPRLDERPYIEEVVSATPVQPHFVFPTEKAFRESLERLLWHQDEPIAGSSVFAQEAVMERARQEGVPVLLDGQGGDETLCGYRKFYYFYLWHLWKGRKSRLAREAWSHLRRGDSLPLDWGDAIRYLPKPFRRKHSVVARLSANGFANRHRGHALSIGPGDSLAARQKQDLVRFSLPVLLRYEDRNSMAHSIETRLPFLDYRLVEFLVNCPENLKLRGGWTKWVLRQAMRGVLPDKIRFRRQKLGFDTPEKEWMRAQLGSFLEDTFIDSQPRTSAYLDAVKVRQEHRSFAAGTSGALGASSLFRPLMLELWARVHRVAA
ncbi:MAG TPA: asparagine synthase (glutamine-hydrolyzing) [Terriglobia bacterium]|nr:asparagine synthase (glutamine-hydrolyzing) [Terriglobia bacterium]